MNGCVACAGPAPALSARGRVPLARLVWARGPGPAGIRVLQAILKAHAQGAGPLVVVAPAGFTEGALALAGRLRHVVLCGP